MILVVIVLFVLYVGSIGPVAWLMNTNTFSPTTSETLNLVLMVFYAPLSLLCEYVEPVGDFIDWYTRLWWKPNL